MYVPKYGICRYIVHVSATRHEYSSNDHLAPQTRPQLILLSLPERWKHDTSKEQHAAQGMFVEAEKRPFVSFITTAKRLKVVTPLASSVTFLRRLPRIHTSAGSPAHLLHSHCPSHRTRYYRQTACERSQRSACRARNCQSCLVENSGLRAASASESLAGIGIANHRTNVVFDGRIGRRVIVGFG